MDDVSCLAEGASWCEPIKEALKMFFWVDLFAAFFEDQVDSIKIYKEYLWIYGNISHLVFATIKVFWSRRPDNIGCLQCKGGRLLTSVAK